MRKILTIFIGKVLAAASRFSNVGSGSTWPGHVALSLYPKVISDFVNQLRYGVILIAGTNGKTTTSKMITTILKDQKFKVIHNQTGANLLNGITSSLISAANWQGKLDVDFGIFEVDEATLPLALKEFTPKIIVILNLFRDQLDRYGEVDAIAENWQKALKNLPKENTLILNADDPEVAHLGKNTKTKVFYFGLNDPRFFLQKMQHAVDSAFCPSCGGRLNYEGITFSHLGIWSCPKCQNKRPRVDTKLWDYYPLPGVYNRYNTLAAVKIAQLLGIKNKNIEEPLKEFKPAFGRQEEIHFMDRKVKILLSKNPTGFNESIRTLSFLPWKKTVVLVLNDRIPDGRDVSWIWDVDFEDLKPMAKMLVASGDRAYDMALRLKYIGIDENKTKVENDLSKAIREAVETCDKGQTLYVLPTYSAMLEVRKILSGKKMI